MLKFLCLFISFSVCLLAVAQQQCSDGGIRMTNGRVTMERDTFYMAGGLQICVSHRWATVCQRGWQDVDATVACRQLGLDYAGTICRNSCFGNILTNPSYYNFGCGRNNAKLQDCHRNRTNKCTNAAGVHCTLNASSLISCSSTTKLVSSSTSQPASHGSKTATTDKSTSNQVAVTSSHPSNSVDMCQKCQHCSNGNSTEGNDSHNNSSYIQQSDCISRENEVVALGIIVALEGVALISVVICLIATCIKLYKISRSAPVIKTHCSMNNRTYGMTDFSENSVQQSTAQVARITADTLPDQTNATDASIAGPVEGLYDTVTSVEEAVYSVLADSDTASTASENAKQNKNTRNKESVAPMSEVHLNSDAIYHVLESDDYQQL